MFFVIICSIGDILSPIFQPEFLLCAAHNEVNEVILTFIPVSIYHEKPQNIPDFCLHPGSPGATCQIMDTGHDTVTSLWYYSSLEILNLASEFVLLSDLYLTCL